MLKIKVFDKDSNKYLEDFLINSSGVVFADNGFGTLIYCPNVEIEIIKDKEKTNVKD